MTMYQKIPTTSTRIHPLMAGAALAVIVLSVVATAAIVRWLPDGSHADAQEPLGDADALPIGYATVSSPGPATAARASSVSAVPAGRQARL
ncbi:hypothetical protein ACFFTM_20575 [Pseudoduganella plicata]|uniref:Uncharacterized protein n=1 Tax=Pseudoduganella plicata TaxID=321984 RepID=A0A4P7BGB0_9BURK|nr:hypothetical protein [Pseudoduganella plicata]QBQ37252.1 hypothetical protein E1742_14515 [Pseudoduganella plicata]GGY98129.1 hypothetical protein GCM10007388_34530 [Pseudoduganella plicata]